MRFFLVVAVLAVCMASVSAEDSPPAANHVPVDLDSDGDGLPDFQERHKYRSDPHRADTAGTGTSDGDPKQRREFTYSVRAVMRLMPPYRLAAMNDDYQDARLLRQTEDYAEVEVVCYPLNTNSDDLASQGDWNRGDARMAEYLEPGVTTNWDAAMRRDLLEALKKDGIDPDHLTHRELVEQVSRWLYARSTYQTMFCTHFVRFSGGRPAVLPGLEAAFEREKGHPAWSVDEQFAHELLGKEMFYRKTHGSCTSAATYQATVLRALGIPTRIIVAAPIIDASDPDQVEMARKNLSHNVVRSTVEYATLAMKNSYSNHTFLEVFVGGRWRRLNYNNLRQNILDSNYLGLMVHVHTFRDLSEADLAATWGKRYALGERDAQFRHSNPYRTLALDDHFGRYAQIVNPPAPAEHRRLTISRIYWGGAADAPELVRKSTNKLPMGAGRLFFHTDEWFDDAGDYLQYKLFLSRADGDFVLKAQDQRDVKCRITSYFTQTSRQVREFELTIPADEYCKMPKGLPFTLHPLNAAEGYQWRLLDHLTIERPRGE